MTSIGTHMLCQHPRLAAYIRNFDASFSYNLHDEHGEEHVDGMD